MKKLLKLPKKLAVSIFIVILYLDNTFIILNYNLNIVVISVSKNQIVRLYSRFLSLDRQGRGYLDREDFLRIPELAINPLGDRIVDAFFTESYVFQFIFVLSLGKL